MVLVYVENYLYSIRPSPKLISKKQLLKKTKKKQKKTTPPENMSTIP